MEEQDRAREERVRREWTRRDVKVLLGDGLNGTYEYSKCVEGAHAVSTVQCCTLYEEKHSEVIV